MLDSVRTYVYDRRSTLSKTAIYAGGFFVAQRYIKDRLDEVKDKLERERVARENLKRRYDQTQENVSFTVMALLTTLSEQILSQMDVEELTQELQSLSRARNPVKSLLRHAQRPSSSLASSIDMMQDTQSEASSTAPSNVLPAPENDRPSSDILQSWVESSGSPSPPPSVISADSHAPHMSNSVMTSASNEISNKEAASIYNSALSESVFSLSAASDSSESRTKAELWNEVKILAFTRTLTTLYSTTLLCLLTTIQLTILARSKYVRSVFELEREERLQETIEANFSMSNLLFGGGKQLEDLISGNLGRLFGEPEGRDEVDDITEEVESKYVTMSWWLLHVGWKDVGERVRRGVEEVFDGVSLKSKLAVIDLHRLVSDVRRRVEHEITFEGRERRINFLSTLLPSTPETIQHVLIQGGFTSQHQNELQRSLESSASLSSSHLFASELHHSHHHHQISPPPTFLPFTHTQDAPFMKLIEETRSIITSSDFAHVLEVCLDRATEVLFTGLTKNVFVSSDHAPGEEVRIRLAGLLPGLAKWSQLALNSLPNELVDNLMDTREISCLSAIVFAQFEDQFR